MIRETMVQKLFEMKRLTTGNPFRNISAIVDSGETDLAARIDEVLYR
ncbi:MAG: hypothetical protein HY820_01345 [Acidobacteria bacterium]|nr:hypothetical protein [Acidobacteriota bacterium]